MKLEAVVVCDKYSDFLSETLPHHRHVFDRLVVVTSHEDLATKRICEYWHVQCVATDALESRKGIFKKGAGVNEGLRALDRDAWMVHMDADIVLPPLFRPTLEAAGLDPSFIYGADRFMVRNHQEWQRFREMPRLLHENGSWVHPTAFQLGTRMAVPAYGGYVPVGFFQLWNAASGITAYPEGHNNAGREDFTFALNWPRAKRAMLPELIVYHLESEHAPMASNWSGRQTLPFTHDGTARQVYTPMAWQERRQGQAAARGEQEE